MAVQHFWNVGRAAGFFLVLSFVANIAGVIMFITRDGTSGNPPPSSAYYAWERGWLMAAIVLAAIGFVLLEGSLHNTDGFVPARTGATIYLVAGILGITAEALGLATVEQRSYPLIVVYVVLALLAQAAIGGALLQSRVMAAWIGWATILWNLAFLIALPLITPSDIYFPILHHIMPLVIGIALLWKTP